MYNFYLKNCIRLPVSGHMRKLLLIMKLTSIILITVILHVSATTLAQKVTLKEKNAPLIDVFNEISAQTGYDFAFTTDALKDAKPVTINVKNEELSEVLTKIFQGQNLEFTLDNKIVVVKEKEPTVVDKIKLILSTIDITGKITDEAGLPLPGATVIVKGTSNSTITDAKGNFTLKYVDNNAVLKISFIGYLTKEVNANGDLSNIKLEVSNSKLDEVQVIAYGQTTERLSTGDVTTVKSDIIEKQPVTNPLLALEGQVPGLFITQSTGIPGAGVSVQIQGQNSIQNGNNPFYVIDGVPYAQKILPNQGYILGSGSGGSNGSPLSFINPFDIESISVLKDADATAIYGSQAANGAIIITTKKGKAGDTRIDFGIQDGIGKVSEKLELLNTQQYLQMRHAAIRNDGLQPSAANGDYDLLLYDTTRYTNWQKVLIGNTAHYGDIYMNVSGGNNNTQFLIGATDHRETSVFPGNFSDEKVSLHFNINNASANQKFHIQLTGNYQLDNNLLPNADLTQLAIQSLPPDAPALHNPDGSLNWAPNAEGASTWPHGLGNPLAYLLRTYQAKTNNLVSNALVSYSIFPGFEIKSSFGYTHSETIELIQVPYSSLDPGQLAYEINSGSYTNNDLNSWIAEPQLTYKKSIGKSNLQGLIGYTVEGNSANGQELGGSNFSSDAFIPNISAAGTVYSILTSASIYRYNAVFGRINYNWDDQFLLNFSTRRDGSSRFGSSSKFHDFSSVGAAWIFTSNEFVKKNFDFLSFGKIRASYGTTGSDQIGDYRYLSNYQTISTGVPYQRQKGLAPINIANPYLQWELTKKLEVSLDLGFFKDRILFNTTYFLNRTSNELLAYNVPITTGFAAVDENLPATVQNNGWEISLTTKNIKHNTFSWTTSLNLTIPKNQLVAFPNLAESSYRYTYEIGKSVNGVHLFHALGVDPATGLYIFSSSAGPTSNPNFTDATIFANTDPKFYGGLQNSFQFQGFELDFLFQFVKRSGFDLNNDNYPGYYSSNQPVSVLGAWQKPGDISSIERYNSTGSLYQQLSDHQYSDAALEDASFIRLKNLSISWKVPDVWAKTIRLKTASLFIRGENLLTFTHYTGLDPETLSSTTLPPLRILTFGLKASL